MPKILRYYLEQEDMALVPQGAGGSSVSMAYPVLSPAGYTAWAIKVEAILDAQGLWEAVSPSGNGVVDAHKNKTARAQLLQALPEDILMQVSTKKTAKEVWESLKTRFVGADRVKTARLATLKGGLRQAVHGGRGCAGRLRREDQRHGCEVRRPRVHAR